jgi:hypothetical protein
MSIETGGYSVSEMPRIQFSDGAQLAGRAPGEAIAGFNSGIGAIDSISNVQQKAIMNPLQASEARARLAQIQAETQLNQAQLPRQQALARIETARATLPIKDPNNFAIVGVPQFNQDGTPSLDSTGKQLVNYMKQESGSEVNTNTLERTPMSEITGVQTPAETINLNQSLMQSRQAHAATQADLADTKSRLADLSGQNADLKAWKIQSEIELNNAHISRLKALESTGKFTTKMVTDPQGNAVLFSVDTKTGQEGPRTYTGMKPVQVANMWSGQDDPAAIKAAADKAAADKAAVDKGSIMNSIGNAATSLKNWATGAPATTTPVTMTPSAAPTSGGLPAMSAADQAAFNALSEATTTTSAPANPSSAAPLKYKMTVVNPAGP